MTSKHTPGPWKVHTYIEDDLDNITIVGKPDMYEAVITAINELSSVLHLLSEDKSASVYKNILHLKAASNKAGGV